MSMPKGARVERGYATISEDDGANYRTIAEEMQKLGHKMNHASARNYLLRAMKKFAKGFVLARGEVLSEDAIETMAKSPNFQNGVNELIQKLGL
jgi:hypothetical protein